jgi:undecaprenyl-diphosphatase
MNFVDAIILGLVQGITEFLPISSSGHLILIRDFFAIDATNALAYDAVLHFATTLAVIIYFRTDLWVLLQAVLRKLGRLPVNERDLRLFYALVIGTIPASILGIFLEPIFSQHLQTTTVVAFMLFCGSLFFIFAEWKQYQRPGTESITIKRGLQIGLFQAMALMPGFSRSGATIAGGMLLGLSRYEASRFSFLLAIPITLAVGSKKSLDLLQAGGTVDWAPILAFVMASIVIHYFLSFIKQYTLWPFIWYGFILSGFVAYVAFIAG